MISSEEEGKQTLESQVTNWIWKFIQEAKTLSRLVTYEPDQCIKCQDIDSKFMSVIKIHVQELSEE